MILTAFPVRYMVVPMKFIGSSGKWCKIIDTSFEGQGTTVCRFMTPTWAHLIAGLMNRAEGYPYYPEGYFNEADY